MEPQDRQRLLDWLEAQQRTIGTIAARGDDRALRAAPRPGRWSALQHLAHIARMHEIYLARVRRILADDRPAMAAYRAEQDDEWPRWDEVALAEILHRLQDRRAELLALLRGLSSEQWQRVGRHSNLGPLTLVEWVEFFLVHEAHHLYAALTLTGAGPASRTTDPPETRA